MLPTKTKEKYHQQQKNHTESVKWYVKKRGKSGNPHTESSLLKSTRPESVSFKKYLWV